MSREIKFRGLRVIFMPEVVDSKWKFGNLLNAFSIGEVGAHLDHYEYAEVIPESVGQFTGLKDKNGIGVDVFEGDIVIYPYRDCEGITYKDTYEVIYKAPMFKLKAIKSSIWKTGAEIYLNDSVEVIGNIFDHPVKPKE